MHKYKSYGPDKSRSKRAPYWHTLPEQHFQIALSLFTKENNIIVLKSISKLEVLVKTNLDGQTISSTYTEATL